jgi:hypothetical protein
LFLTQIVQFLKQTPESKILRYCDIHRVKEENINEKLYQNQVAHTFSQASVEFLEGKNQNF